MGRLRRIAAFRLWLALLILCAGCGAVGSAEDNATAISTADSLRVVRGEFHKTVLLAGTLEASESIQITAPRTPSWQVQVRWMIEDGANVSTGQKILELDNTSFTTDLEEKRLQVRKDEKQLQQQRAQADATAAEKRFAVEQRLVELDKAKLTAAIPAELIPMREYQESQLALEKAQTAYDKATGELTTHTRTAESELAIQRVALRQIREEIRIAEKAIEELTVAAPRDGVVIIGDVRRERRKLQVGDNVWPGFAIMRIPNLEKMQVVAHLSDVDDGELSPGMVARVGLESYPALSFRGKIRDITPVAQEVSPRSLRRAFRVRVDLEETNSEIMRPGMAARIEVSAASSDNALLIPRTAIDFSQDQPRALARSGEWLEFELGPCNARVCICEGGIDDGQALLLVGVDSKS